MTNTQPERPTFIGDWLVSEYLYTPAGEYAGLIHQQRQLQPMGDLIRIIQICEPVKVAAPISAQAQAVVEKMNNRVGQFMFELQAVGPARHYLGPDVVGGGFSWGTGALTGRGMWPRFGYNFTSFSILLAPHRQVTGGKFFIANEEIATIVGVATPAEAGYPELQVGQPGPTCSGDRQILSPTGALQESKRIGLAELVSQNMKGVPGREKSYGPLRETVGVAAPGQTFALIEVYDHATGTLAGLGKWFQDEKLGWVELYRLTDQRPAVTSKG